MQCCTGITLSKHKQNKSHTMIVKLVETIENIAQTQPQFQNEAYQQQ